MRQPPGCHGMPSEAVIRHGIAMQTSSLHSTDDIELPCEDMELSCLKCSSMGGCVFHGSAIGLSWDYHGITAGVRRVYWSPSMTLPWDCHGTVAAS